MSRVKKQGAKQGAKQGVKQGAKQKSNQESNQETKTPVGHEFLGIPAIPEPSRVFFHLGQALSSMGKLYETRKSKGGLKRLRRLLVFLRYRPTKEVVEDFFEKMKNDIILKVFSKPRHFYFQGMEDDQAGSNEAQNDAGLPNQVSAETGDDSTELIEAQREERLAFHSINKELTNIEDILASLPDDTVFAKTECILAFILGYDIHLSGLKEEEIQSKTYHFVTSEIALPFFSTELRKAGFAIGTYLYRAMRSQVELGNLGLAKRVIGVTKHLNRSSLTKIFLEITLFHLLAKLSGSRKQTTQNSEAFKESKFGHLPYGVVRLVIIKELWHSSSEKSGEDALMAFYTGFFTALARDKKLPYEKPPSYIQDILDLEEEYRQMTGRKVKDHFSYYDQALIFLGYLYNRVKYELSEAKNRSFKKLAGSLKGNLTRTSQLNAIFNFLCSEFLKAYLKDLRNEIKKNKKSQNERTQKTEKKQKKKELPKYKLDLLSRAWTLIKNAVNERLHADISTMAFYEGYHASYLINLKRK